jgi:hypothetical protein
MICSTLCRFFMGSTGFTPQNSHSTLSSFSGLDHGHFDSKQLSRRGNDAALLLAASLESLG